MPFAVHDGRIEHAFRNDSRAVGRDLAKKAGRVSLVAGGAPQLFDFQQHGVAVAIDVQFMYKLLVAARFPLTPQLAATTAEIHGPACSQSFVPGRAVHVRNHQHGTGRRILSDGSDKSVGAGEGRSDRITLGHVSGREGMSNVAGSLSITPRPAAIQPRSVGPPPPPAQSLESSP